MAGLARKVDVGIRLLRGGLLGTLLRIPVSDFFRNDKVLVFHHIPKCAGMSILEALEKWFYVIRDYRPGGSDDTEPPLEDPRSLS